MIDQLIEHIALRSQDAGLKRIVVHPGNSLNIEQRYSNLTLESEIHMDRKVWDDIVERIAPPPGDEAMPPILTFHGIPVEYVEGEL